MSKARDRRRVWIAAIALAVAGLCVWLFLSASPPASRSSRQVETGVTTTALATEPSATGAVPPPPRRVGKPITPEVSRLRARVLESLGSQSKDRTEKVAKGSNTPAAALAAEQRPAEIKDRTGELNPETMRVINHELMPLVRECYDLAHERNPQLRGMLAVGIELAAAEELGTIIEAVEPVPERNELNDSELIECVRQSAFSVELPMPVKSGRISRELTLKFDGDDDPGVKR